MAMKLQIIIQFFLINSGPNQYPHKSQCTLLFSYESHYMICEYHYHC